MAVPLLRTLILYCAVICAVRLMGKRQIGELDPVSYTHLASAEVGLSISRMPGPPFGPS